MGMIRIGSGTRPRRSTTVTPFAAPGGGWRVAAFGAAVLMLAGCGGDAGESGDLVIAEGRALYEVNCLMCHGPGALGDGPMAASLPVRPPRLMDHLGHHTEAQLFQLIQGGVPPAMPPTGVSDAEARLIVDYLWTLVPESEVAALREMQRHTEMMGDSPMGSMPGMSGMQGMDHSTMDHSTMDHSAMDDSAHAEHMMEMDAARAPDAPAADSPAPQGAAGQ